MPHSFYFNKKKKKKKWPSSSTTWNFSKRAFCCRSRNLRDRRRRSESRCSPSLSRSLRKKFGLRNARTCSIRSKQRTFNLFSNIVFHVRLSVWRWFCKNLTSMSTCRDRDWTWRSRRRWNSSSARLTSDSCSFRGMLTKPMKIGREKTEEKL